MRRIHVYYIIFLINVINLFAKMYCTELLEKTIFYKIDMSSFNSNLNNIINTDNNYIYDKGSYDLITIIYCLLSFFMGVYYSNHSMFLYFIYIIFESLSIIYLDNSKMIAILISLLFFIFGRMFRKKKKINQYSGI